MRYAILPDFLRYRYILRYLTELNCLLFYRLSASYLSILQTVYYALILDIKRILFFIVSVFCKVGDFKLHYRSLCPTCKQRHLGLQTVVQGLQSLCFSGYISTKNR